MDFPLSFWLNNREKISTKNYKCYYNGIQFGKEPQLYFVYKTDQNENVFGNGTPKSAYIEAVTFACSISKRTLNNFLNPQAEKFGVFSAKSHDGFSEKTKRSTRTTGENGRIEINHKIYYVATNLNVCEYYNSLCDSVVDIGNWFVRVDYDKMQIIKDPEEHTIVKLNSKDILLTEITDNQPKKSKQSKTKRTVKINYLLLGVKKKELGDLGECLVIELEKTKLTNAGRSDLAKKIVHTALTNDNAGFDIESFTPDGKKLYIEVKTTSYDKEDDFIISSNEIKTALETSAKGDSYCIYRVYNFDSTNNTGDYKVFYAPFDECFEFTPISFRAKKKQK